MTNIKDILNIEINISGTLDTLFRIEQLDGNNSAKFKSLCGLLSDFLSEEEELFKKFYENKENLNCCIANILDADINKIDETISIFSFDYEEATIPKVYKLFKKYQGGLVYELLNCKYAVEFLESSNNKALKYKYAFMMPELCHELIKTNFDINMINSNKYDIYSREEKDRYLYKRFIELFYLISSNQDEDLSLYMDYLAFLRGQMSDELIEKAKEYLKDDAQIDEKLISKIEKELFIKQKRMEN